MADLIEIMAVWQHLQSLVLTLQEPLTASVPLTPLQTTQLYGEIVAYFEQQIMAVVENPWPLAVAGKMRSYTTEIHRLLKLMQRDLIFWHSARQPLTRAQRLAEILGKLHMIMQFIQSMIEELNTTSSL
jgi:hypothetical protein